MIRKAEEKDFESVVSLRKQVHEIHFNNRPDFFKKDGSIELEEYNNLLKSDEEDVFVYEYDNSVVGYMVLKEVIKEETKISRKKKILLIEEIGVDKSIQGKGIGKKLFEYAKKLVIMKNFDTLELTVWEFNQEAIKFYECIGMNTRRRTMEYVLHKY